MTIDSTLRHSSRLSLATALSCILGSSFCAAATADSAQRSADPILTRPAATAQGVTIIANAKYFEDVELEEADEFDGYGFDFEVVVPFRDNMQLRFILPAYIDGEATLTDPPTGERIDIDGPAGTFDFPTILFEHQVIDQADANYNLAYFLGYGQTIANWGKLDTSHGDTFNHQGILFRLGLKADGSAADGDIRWLTNAGLRIYSGSDDLNPAQSGDTFTFLDWSGAIIFNHFNDYLLPAVELSYRGDVDDYNAVHLIPQVIVPIDEKFELKAGAPLGLSGDGESWGLRLQLSYRM